MSDRLPGRWLSQRRMTGSRQPLKASASWAPCSSSGMMRIMETVPALLGANHAGAVAALSDDHPARTWGDRR